MKIRYLKGNCLDDFKKDVRENRGKYGNPTSWLKEYFDKKGNPNFFNEASMEIEIPKLGVSNPSKPHESDFENSKELFLKMKDLSPSIAGMEAFWTYYCHDDGLWDYMRARWPIEEKTTVETIKMRYFFMPTIGRAIIRNGLSRLWWYAYSTYDPSRGDPFELTKVLLEDQDQADSLMGRNFYRNRDIFTTVLEEIKTTGALSREEFRDLAKYINRIGGVALIDAIPQKRLQEMIKGRIGEMIDSR